MRIAVALLNLIATAAAYCPAFLEQENACTCFSYVDGAVIKCVGLDGPAVVEKLKNVFTEIRELSIQKANIIEVGPFAFRTLKVKSLILDHNKIEKIHPDAFRGLEDQLQKLSISNNKLTEVPTDSLAGLSNLQVLNLECNNIGDIYGSVFNNVTSLIELNMACNQICKINGPAFDSVKTSLQSLILDQNCLKEIPAEALRNFQSLLALHLQYNAIESIEKLQLMNLVSLLMIRLTGNRIRNVDRYGLTNVPNLRYLFLNQNNLTNIEPNVLQQFKHLEIVDLSFNNIVEITGDSFRSLEHLMQLNLEGNSIRDIAPHAFSNTPLLLLILSKNCLSSINQQMFQGIPFLRQLSLADNNIRVVQPLSFSPLGSLHMLDLSRNKLQVIQPGALTASPHVTVLLQENPVVCTQQGFHIVQSGQPIHLLNEPNEICKTDYTNDAGDVCPNRRTQPDIPACCHAYKPVDEITSTTTSTPLWTTTPVLTRRTTTTPFPSESINTPIPAFSGIEPQPQRVQPQPVQPQPQPVQPEPVKPAPAPATIRPSVNPNNTPIDNGRPSPDINPQPVTTTQQVPQAPRRTQRVTERPRIVEVTTRAPRVRGSDRLKSINTDRFLRLSGGGGGRRLSLDSLNSRASGIRRSRKRRPKVNAVPQDTNSGRSGPLSRPNRGPQVPVIPRVPTRVGSATQNEPETTVPVNNKTPVIPSGFVDTRLRAGQTAVRGEEVITEGGRGDFRPNSGLPIGENAEFPTDSGPLPPWIGTGTGDTTGLNIQEVAESPSDVTQPQNSNRRQNVRTLPKSQVSIGGQSSQTPQKFV